MDKDHEDQLFGRIGIFPTKGSGYGSTQLARHGIVVSAAIFAPSAWKKTVDGQRVQCREEDADFDRVDVLWAMLPGARYHLDHFQASRLLDIDERVDIHIGKTPDGIQLEILSQLQPVDGSGLRRVIFHVMVARHDLLQQVVREKKRRARSARGGARARSTPLHLSSRRRESR